MLTVLLFLRLVNWGLVYREDTLDGKGLTSCLLTDLNEEWRSGYHLSENVGGGG